MKKKVEVILIILITFITEVVIAGYGINSNVKTLEVISGSKGNIINAKTKPGFLFKDYNQNVNFKIQDEK